MMCSSHNGASGGLVDLSPLLAMLLLNPPSTILVATSDI